MTTETARSAVKARMGITVTTWDTLIDGFVVSAVSRLYPRAKYEIAPQNVASVSPDDLGEVTYTLSALTTPILEARKIETYDGFAWSRVTDTYHHADTLVIRGITSDVTAIRIYGLTNFADITKVYDWLTQAVIWYAMAEFYDYLAGNKRSYNIYAQSSGARAVDNMADQSAYYGAQADRYIEEQNTSYGL
jgi:hypothetical protein